MGRIRQAVAGWANYCMRPTWSVCDGGEITDTPTAWVDTLCRRLWSYYRNDAIEIWLFLFSLLLCLSGNVNRRSKDCFNTKSIVNRFIFGFSFCWAFVLTGCRSDGISFYRDFVLLGFRSDGFSFYWPIPTPKWANIWMLVATEDGSDWAPLMSYISGVLAEFLEFDVQRNCPWAHATSSSVRCLYPYGYSHWHLALLTTPVPDGWRRPSGRPRQPWLSNIVSDQWPLTAEALIQWGPWPSKQSPRIVDARRSRLGLAADERKSVRSTVNIAKRWLISVSVCYYYVFIWCFVFYYICTV